MALANVRPKTLLRPIAMPAVQGMQYPVGANPQVALSGLSVSPFMQMVFEDANDVSDPRSNVVFRMNQNKVAAPIPLKNYVLTGVVRDNSGNPVAGATVVLMTSIDNLPQMTTVSDATGTYTFTLPSGAQPLKCDAYLSGAPDRAGSSLNTLQAV